ncbi:nuclear transport factor 2 family protein [Algoriphagus sp.]|uniref:nuclear transport factor 2 family protein n=1 Tax=Algoriphagus sp. TaxID=1872435 RepID=UPI0032969689
MKNREEIIKNYIEGYNSFDIQKMTRNFSDDILFENIQDGVTTLTLKGIQAFAAQAEETKFYFSKRKQTLLSFKHVADKIEIEIDYWAVLAIDLPNGLKKGDEIKLRGRSIFEFSNDKIIMLTDES